MTRQSKLKPPKQQIRSRASSSHGVSERLVRNALIVALVGSAFVIDPFAVAAFDAPKRLIAMMAAVFGAAVMAISIRFERPEAWSGRAKFCLASGIFALTWMFFSTLFSPHGLQAWTGLRTLVAFFLFAMLGAAIRFRASTRVMLTWTVIFAIAINAAISLLQALGLTFPIPIQSIAGRFPNGALLGNEGYVSLACAFLGAGCLPFLNRARNWPHRFTAAALLLLSIATILINQQRTSLIALLAAAFALLAVRLFRARISGLLISAFLFAAICVPLLFFAFQTPHRVSAQSLERYQQITTYRLSAWASACEMIRERPLLGFGLGTYMLESTALRLKAETRLAIRLKIPPNTNAFSSAHNDYLQLAAEAGVPDLIAILMSLGFLITGLARIIRTSNNLEAHCLFAILIAGAVSALAWFPMQIPFTAALLLLICGRSWRLIADDCGPARA